MKDMFLTIKLKNVICGIIALATVLSLSFAFADIGDAEGVEVPIIMYHSILKDNSGSQKYIVTPTQLESDLKYLKDNGYTAVTVNDLIEYVYNQRPLPEKPIVLTFDDGYYNNYYYAYPLIKKYNMKMVVSIVGKFTDTFSENDDSNPNYSYLTWKQIDDMQKSGFAEILNHTYNLHSTDSGRNGCKKKRGESDAEYEKLLTDDLTKLQEKLKEQTGTAPNAFTYPFGGISNASCEIIKKLGFKASLSCGEGINTITDDKECLYLLKRFIRPSGTDSEAYFKKVLGK